MGENEFPNEQNPTAGRLIVGNAVRVFIKRGFEKTGLGRYASGISVADNVEVYSSHDFSEFKGLAFNPEDIGIFAGYLPQDIEAMLPQFKRTYYVFCSPIGQAYLSQNYDNIDAPIELQILLYVRHLIYSKKLTNVICTSKDLAEVVRGIHLPAVIPNPDMTFCEQREGYSFVGNNIRKHKNVANTLAGISALPKESVYVSDPAMYEFYTALFGLDFVQCRHEDDSQMHKAMAAHKLLFQCSFSESFSYLALEYAFHGVPCICSPCISWYPLLECRVRNVDSPLSILAAAELVLKGNYASYSKRLIEFATMFNDKNIKQMKELVPTL